MMSTMIQIMTTLYLHRSKGHQRKAGSQLLIVEGCILLDGHIWMESLRRMRLWFPQMTNSAPVSGNPCSREMDRHRTDSIRFKARRLEPRNACQAWEACSQPVTFKYSDNLALSMNLIQQVWSNSNRNSYLPDSKAQPSHLYGMLTPHRSYYRLGH